MTKLEAHAMVTKLCREQRHKPPRWITIHQSTAHRSSSGRAGYGRLHVTLGHDGYDHEETVIHEVTHLLVGRKGREWHSKRFWTTHYRLCAKYGVTTDDKRNLAYKAKAAVAIA